jgi:hypothetical protein
VSSSREWRFAVRHRGQGVGAFKLQFTKHDIYVFVYERDGTSPGHVSYHASGQQHIKWRGQYRWYRRESSGGHRPEIWLAPAPTHITGRQQIIGLSWGLVDYFGLGPLPVNKIRKPEFIEVPPESEYDRVLFELNVLGAACRQRVDYFGHEIFWRKCLSGFVTLEIEGVGMRLVSR